jgi:arylformamidase
MIHDISRPLDDTIEIYPGDPRFLCEIVQRNPAVVSRLEMGVHTGTHVDAPLHFIPGGASVDQIAVDTFIGPCQVVEGAKPPPLGTTRALFRAESLTPELARHLVEEGIRLVGISSLSVDAIPSPDHPVHHILLSAGVAIVEGLVLQGVEPGAYRLCVLPLALIGAEAAPARAIIERFS